MKVLWVVNTIFPDAARYLGQKPTVFGGWMYGTAERLAQSSEVNLSVATAYTGKDVCSFRVGCIDYWLLPAKKGKIAHDDWCKVATQIAPEIVHIHGTEYGYGMTLMEAMPELKFIISIQGLVSVYHRYYLAGMSFWDVFRNLTFRDIVRRDTLFQSRRKFYLRGLTEVKYIQQADALIGRTDWDRAHVKAINPAARYFTCNESLRDIFYEGDKWSFDECRRNSIFISQASYPIKGFHQVLKAAALLKNRYPDLLIEVAGDDITASKTLKDRLRRNGYGCYIKNLIKKYGLDSNVKFLGTLSAEEMKQAYLRAHVFICPSSIENSPNSLGEAQILGVPSIASYSGGIPSMVTYGRSAILYPFEEFEMLSDIVDGCFSHKYNLFDISRLSIIDASKRYGRKLGVLNSISIYKTVMSSC